MEFPNIARLLAERTAATPDKPFLFSELDGRSWTYAQFSGAVQRAAAALASRGIGRGDVVSLLLPNSAEYIVAYFACWHLGAIAGPINSLLKREEIEWAVANSESKLLIVAPEFADRVQPGNSGAPACMSAAAARTIDDPLPNRQTPHLLLDDVSALPEGTIEPADLSPDDEAIIIYTSGTTGKPKGCLLTHGNLIANARQITEWMRFGPEDRLLTVMPLFHMNAVTVTTMTALYCGGSTVVSPKFSASRFWEIVERYQVTSFGSVATMLSMLLSGGNASVNERGDRAACTSPRVSKGDTSDSSLSPSLTVGLGQDHPATLPSGRISARRLRFAMCGSAPVPSEVLRRFEETFGILVIEGYGLSESTCRSTFNPPDERRRPGSCGLPIGNEMRIVDDDDNDVPDGELGEIVLRGPNIFKGYFNNPEATRTASRSGWFHTGDIGRRDPDGFYYIADRKTDMIIRAGENIYPREIDDLLYTHPAVAAAAAIGVPDDLYGEEVTAFIVLKPGYYSAESVNDGRGEPGAMSGGNASVNERGERASGLPDDAYDQVSSAAERVHDSFVVSESEIIDFCRRHLADYKCPKTIHFVPDIPKGPTGKLLKRELAKMLKR